MKISIIQSGGALARSGVQENHVKQIKKVSSKIEVEILEESDSAFEKELAETEVLISSRFIDFKAEQIPDLKWIHITSAGVNNLSKYLINSDIKITNSSGVHPVPISEHVLGMMLMLARSIDIAHKNQITEKKWMRSDPRFRGVELFGKKLLVVGMGRIGERVAELATAFGMEVSGVVRNLKGHDTKVKLYAVKDLEKKLKDVDFVVNCLPATEETSGMFNKKIFTAFKDGAFFVNIGRGDTVVTEDLIKALQSKKLAGVGLDVTEPEPLPESSPLWGVDNVIITPHISGLSPHYTDRMIAIFIENLKAYLDKKEMPNIVNKSLGY